MTADVKFFRLAHGEGLPLPAYARDGDSGMDLSAAGWLPDWADGGVLHVLGQTDGAVIEPGHRMLIATGFAVELPPGHEAQIRPRSGLALKHGVTVLNTPGTIDAGYRGEVRVILVNLGHEAVGIRRGDRIAQLVIAPVTRVGVVEVDGLSQTERWTDGLGSTGQAGEAVDVCPACNSDAPAIDTCPVCEGRGIYVGANSSGGSGSSRATTDDQRTTQRRR